MPSVNDIEERLREIGAAVAEAFEPSAMTETLGSVLALWRDRSFAPRRETIAQVSERLGFSVSLLDESLDALLLPFTREALHDIAHRASPRRQTLGFIMAGNVLGAGLHEIAIALISGAGCVIKTASREPFFFESFIRSLADASVAAARRVAVFNWPRDRDDLNRPLISETDLTIAYGDDATIGALSSSCEIIGFGSKVSGALVMSGNRRDVALALALDVTLFEQLGCLSPHQVFVHGTADDAREFSEMLANAMRDVAVQLAPPWRLELEDAAALRSIRETARWRAIGGEPVRLIEGSSLSWCVIFDRDVHFKASPGFRVVRVSPVRDLADLRERLAPVDGRLEAFAIAGTDAEVSAARGILHQAGVSYFAAPGAMQSPPLTWRHGNGVFLDRMISPP